MRLSIRGARENNLQNLSVDFADGLTVVTGVSGSGKTSLVFDTLYHESRRRFLESFSSGSSNLRLAPAAVESISGLGPAVAVGQNLLNRNPDSTLASASGLHPFLRLLYARFADRSCARCGFPVARLSEDEVLERLLQLVQAEKVLTVCAPLVRQAIGSHRTLLALLAETFGADRLRIDGKTWLGQALDPWEPHDIELELADIDETVTVQLARSLLQQVEALGISVLALKNEGHEWLLARAPVCAHCGLPFADLDPSWFHQKCPLCRGRGCATCEGSGLRPEAAATRWQGLRLDQLLALTVDQIQVLFRKVDLHAGAVRLHQEIDRRLDALQAVGLGYVSLNRPSPSLSRGEAQRVRLAVSLTSRLEDMLHVLDEPTIGQHPADVARLLPVFRKLGGPVIYVEHDRTAAAYADHAVDLGPGAGSLGGHLLYSGPPAGLWRADTPTGRFFSLRQRVTADIDGHDPKDCQPGDKWITVQGAYLHNLRKIDVSIPMGRLTVITGVSGSGKSTLVEDVLVASLTDGQARGCDQVDSPPVRVTLVDQSPIGINPRSNAATYTGLADIIRDLYATASGLSSSHFSFNRPEGACPTCQGMGAVEVRMRYLPSTWIPCSDCEGQRFSESVLAVRVPFGQDGVQGIFNIAEFLNRPIGEVASLLAGDARIPLAKRNQARRILAALHDIGLDYLSLSQPSPTLSGGESQRVKLAKYLGQKNLTNELLVLDEPSTGLHPQDIAGLLTVLHRLVGNGATVVLVEHDLDIIRTADWNIELGPGAGPDGGRIVYAGTPAGLSAVAESMTGKAMRDEDKLMPNDAAAVSRPEDGREQNRTFIRIRGARANNLRQVDVDIPKGALTVVTGVSGSGKSSLVHGILEAEARRRFLESLSLYERQGLHEGTEAEVDSVSGLGVTASIGTERRIFERRATVGTATDLAHHLAALLAWLGERDCPDCGNGMERAKDGRQWFCPGCGLTAPIAQPRHFMPSQYTAACLRCNGVGTTQVPCPEKLIIHPEKPLCDGAMYSPGFFPKGYLGKPFNGGYDLVQALAAKYSFDPMVTPWNQMSPASQQAFLFGDPEPMTVVFRSRTGRERTGLQPFPGFYGWIRDWDVGGTYTDTHLCPVCAGARLRPEYAQVRLAGFTSQQLNEAPLCDLPAMLDSLTALVQNATNAQIRQLAAPALQTAQRRLLFLSQVGLGYLTLNRSTASLSAGEAQRIRLAGLLGSELTSLTVLLDEPTRGLHPGEVQALLNALLDLRTGGNTVVVVEHDPLLMLGADHLIDMGPGAGVSGGCVVAQGSPAEVLQSTSVTAAWLRNERQILPDRDERFRRSPQGWLVIHGARANNLCGEDVHIPLGVLTGVCGVSGSGKSTLIMDTLGRALVPKKYTTSVAAEPIDPGPHDSIDGAPQRTLLIDQTKAGVASPVDFLDLNDKLIRYFAEREEASALGLDAPVLSRRCSACGGSGVQTIDMGFLPDVHESCETCRGTGFLPEAWQVRVRGIALPELFNKTIAEVCTFAAEDPILSRPLEAACAVGLGYLVLRQPGHSLSGGEAQRLKIAAELCRKEAQKTLYILDEPTVGQHLEDVSRLNGVLQRLVDAGHSVLIVEHHPHLLAACDWLIELGPGGGPRGGHVIAAGTPEKLAQGMTPTAPWLREILEAKP